MTQKQSVVDQGQRKEKNQNSEKGIDSLDDTQNIMEKRKKKKREEKKEEKGGLS